ncbi:MAG: hypothetical protein GXY36_05935 [Chloroflexi bacterium]|nr:hypothetical protein [Chloroflexota bacterium]
MSEITRQASSIPLFRERVLNHWLNQLGQAMHSATGTALLVWAGAALLWLFSLQNADPDQMGNFGLLSVLPLPYFVALGLLIINTTIILNQQKVPEYVFLLHVVLLIFIIHGTPQILYGTLRYSWAWKHIGIIEYIQRHGTVDPTISSLPAYHNWPGFFTLNAFIVQVAGLKNALSFAGWSPVFFNLIDLGALLLIYRSCTRDRRLVGLGIWFFFITNWVGQDYFSPQATGYFLHLVILGICLTWFKTTPLPRRHAIRHWLRSERLTARAYKLLYLSRRAEMPVFQATPAQRIGLVGILTLFFMTIASSHQLTPVMTIASLGGLVLVFRLSIRSLPAIYGIMAVLWIVYMAVPFLTPTVESFIEALGNPAENAQLIDLSLASVDQQIVAMIGRSLTLCVMALAGLGMLRYLVRGYLNLSFIVLIGAPVSTMAMNTYGGEIIFRVYLFALPFLAFFIATLFYPSLKVGRSLWTVVLPAVLSVLLLTGLLFAYYGKDRQYYFAEDEVAASEYLYSIAPPNSLIIEGSRSYASQHQNYELYTYVAIDREPWESQQEIINDPVNVMTRWMSNRAYAGSFLIITRSQKAAIEMVGSMPDNQAIYDLEDALLASGRFKAIFRSPNAVVLVLDQDPHLRP